MISALPAASVAASSHHAPFVEVLGSPQGILNDYGQHAWTTIRNVTALPLPAQGEWSRLCEGLDITEHYPPDAIPLIVAMIERHGWTVADDWIEGDMRHVRMSPSAVV